MPKRLTTEEFIAKARIVHGDKYDYSKVEYIGNQKKVCIICPIHGEFWQRPHDHIAGHGCDACGGTANLDTEAFIKRAKEIHGEKYDYSESQYINSRTKVCIICSIHGSFLQMPGSHLHGNGCPDCGGNTRIDTEIFIQKARATHGDKYDYSLVEYNGTNNIVKIICPVHGVFEQKAHLHIHGAGCVKCKGLDRKNTAWFIEKSINIHGNRYDYSKVNYINNHEHVRIICPIHGEFSQRPSMHLCGEGCPDCARTRLGLNRRLTTEEFINKSQIIHGNKYDYSRAIYTTSDQYITIICPKHGAFEQIATNHLSGQGCPHCKKSRGESKIREWLISHNIKFEIEHRIVPQLSLFGRNKLRVDFYLPNHNTIIEYHGIQHYERQPNWQSEESFQEQQDRDRRVREYCKHNKIGLIEIPYTDFDRIDKILSRKLQNK